MLEDKPDVVSESKGWKDTSSWPEKESDKWSFEEYDSEYTDYTDETKETDSPVVEKPRIQYTTSKSTRSEHRVREPETKTFRQMHSKPPPPPPPPQIEESSVKPRMKLQKLDLKHEYRRDSHKRDAPDIPVKESHKKMAPEVPKKLSPEPLKKGPPPVPKRAKREKHKKKEKRESREKHETGRKDETEPTHYHKPVQQSSSPRIVRFSSL